MVQLIFERDGHENPFRNNKPGVSSLFHVTPIIQNEPLEQVCALACTLNSGGSRGEGRQGGGGGQLIPPFSLPQFLMVCVVSLSLRCMSNEVHTGTAKNSADTQTKGLTLQN